MPRWSTETYQGLTLAALAVAALSLLVLLAVLARLRVLDRAVRRGTAARGTAATGPDPRALRHVAVVRYDAFADMGGRLSFSVALLDDQGDGLVLSSINGRSETRTYAKSMVGLRSEQALSPEEQQAIAAARRA